MANDVSVQYNGKFSPDIILLTLYHYHRGARLNAIRRFCLCSPCPNLSVSSHFPLQSGGYSEGLDAFRNTLNSSIRGFQSGMCSVGQESACTR